ncbi:hypothetical protein Hanom_Chr06g00532031 [Helianthus anomalus]
MRHTVSCLSGVLRASLSNFKHSPPAFSILALAVSVNLRAVTYLMNPNTIRNCAHNHNNLVFPFS